MTNSPTTDINQFLGAIRESEEMKKSALQKLLLVPDEMRAIGAPGSAIAVAEEIARTARRLLAAENIQ